MGDVINFPIALDSDQGHALIVDLCRFAEGILDEKAVKKKYRLAESVWKELGENDALVEKIEAETRRRIQDGSCKRERAQVLITKAPAILDGIMCDPGASARHRVDAIKTLDSFAAPGAQETPASNRFVISIILNADGSDHVEHYNKATQVDANDVDPNTVLEESTFTAIAAKKNEDDDGDRHF